MPTTLPNCRLSEVADIKLGQSFRSTVLEDPKGSVYAIRTKDVLPGGHLSRDLMPVSELRGRLSPNVAEGDVLILCRGVRFNAAVAEGLPGPAVAQNMFHILKLREGSPVSPAYLASFLNHPTMQERLKDQATKGTSVGHLRVDALKDLKIPIPSIEVQRKLAALADAVAEEQQLLEKLANLRRQQLSAAFSQLI